MSLHRQLHPDARRRHLQEDLPLDAVVEDVFGHRLPLADLLLPFLQMDLELCCLLAELLWPQDALQHRVETRCGRTLVSLT